MKFLKTLWAQALSVVILTVSSHGSSSGISFPPTSTGGHDFNHAPIGQSFTAMAADVTGGIYLADQGSYSTTPYPYAVAPSVTVRIDLLQGEGGNGTVLHSCTQTLTAPFNGFVNVDYGAAGVYLTPGGKYTILLTDLSAQIYPQDVTGWVVPSVIDPNSGTEPTVYSGGGNAGANLPAGAYFGGLPILQGILVTADAGVGDNAFQVLDNAPVGEGEIVSGVNGIITAYAPRVPGFIVINGGLNLNDHLWTTNLNESNTVFLDGLTNWFQTGLLVDYTGVTSPQGVILTHLTVKKAPSILLINDASLPVGTVGAAYTAPVEVTGGTAPYAILVAGLPKGLTFDGASIAGTPRVAGAFSLLVTVTDAVGTVAEATLPLTIALPAPSYSTPDRGKGRITAVGEGYLLVGTKKLIWDAKTQINVHTPQGEIHVIDSAVQPGMKVKWKGLRDRPSNTVLTSGLDIE